MNSSCTSYFYCSSWFCQSWMQFPEVPLLRSVLVEPQPQNFSPSWFHKRLFLRCVSTQLSCIRTRFWCCTCTWCVSVQACCIAEGCEGKVKDHTCKKAWVVPPPFMQKYSLQVVTDSAFGWLLFKCKNTFFFFFSYPDSTSPRKVCCRVQCITLPNACKEHYKPVTVHHSCPLEFTCLRVGVMGWWARSLWLIRGPALCRTSP